MTGHQDTSILEQLPCRGSSFRRGSTVDIIFHQLCSCTASLSPVAGHPLARAIAIVARVRGFRRRMHAQICRTLLSRPPRLLFALGQCFLQSEATHINTRLRGHTRLRLRIKQGQRRTSDGYLRSSISRSVIVGWGKKPNRGRSRGKD